MAGSWREVIEAGNTEVQPCWSVHWCPHKHRPVLKKKAHVQEWLAQKCHCGAQELGDPWGQCEKLLTSPQYHVNMLTASSCPGRVKLNLPRPGPEALCLSLTENIYQEVSEPWWVGVLEWRGCTVEVGSCSSATAQSALRGSLNTLAGSFQHPQCRHNIWLLARGCCQGLHSGSKTKHIFTTKSRMGCSRAPGSEACALTHTFVRARRVYLKVLLLAL